MTRQLNAAWHPAEGYNNCPDIPVTYGKVNAVRSYASTQNKFVYAVIIRDNNVPVTSVVNVSVVPFATHQLIKATSAAKRIVAFPPRQDFIRKAADEDVVS